MAEFSIEEETSLVWSDQEEWPESASSQPLPPGEKMMEGFRQGSDEAKD